jgi:hypothetical protein
LIAAHTVTAEEATTHLARVLELQPWNYKALYQLAETLVSKGQAELARSRLLEILTHEPFIESNRGIMNIYINGVFTNAFWKDNVRSKAAELLLYLGGQA